MCSSSRVRGLGETTVAAEAGRTAFRRRGMRALRPLRRGSRHAISAVCRSCLPKRWGQYVTHAPEDCLVAHVNAHGSDLALVVPALASRLPGLLPESKATDPHTERYLLVAVAMGLLATASERQPVVLGFDDLHGGQCQLATAAPSDRCGSTDARSRLRGLTSTVNCHARNRSLRPWLRCVGSAA
jgi:hypothetical protein